MASQKVVIPKGLINPNETTIIEIPESMQRVPAVVAIRRNYGNDSSLNYTDSSYEYGDRHSGRGRSRRSPYFDDYGDFGDYSVYDEYSEITIPDYPSYPVIPSINGDTLNELRVRKELQDFSGKGRSFGSYGLDDSGMSNGPFEDWVQKNTSWRLEHPSIVGPHLDADESSFDYSNPELRKRGFDPYVHTYQMRKFASPYKDFHPKGRSTPKGHIPTDESARNWLYATLQPDDESFWVPQSPASPYASQRPNKMSCGVGKSESMTEIGIKQVLDKMEFIELSKIQKDLKDFQTARRKLIFDATNMTPPQINCSSEV